MDWVTSIFVSVDKRYGDEWQIPYRKVQAALDEMSAHNMEMAESTSGLKQLLMYGAGEYALKVTDIARHDSVRRNS